MRRRLAAVARRDPGCRQPAPRYAAAMTEPRLSPADQELLAQLSDDERDLVLWAIATYPRLSVAEAIEHSRAGGM